MVSVDRILSSMMRQGGGRLIDAAVRRTLPDKPEPSSGKSNLLRGIVGAVAMRVATRSVPGAILVGSAALAKKLYDRRQSRRAPAEKPAPKA